MEEKDKVRIKYDSVEGKKGEEGIITSIGKGRNWNEYCVEGENVSGIFYDRELEVVT